MAEQQRQHEDPSVGRHRADQALSLVIKVLESPHVRDRPIGTFVIVNLDTGEYVTASTLMDATDSFQQKFPNATGFAHRVGEPLFEPLWTDE